MIRKLRMRTRRLTAFILSAVCLWLPTPTYAQEAAIPLSITVVDGADQIINANRMPDILVRVTAAGAAVTFKLPAESGVSFPGGGTQMTLTSDLQGFARSGRMSGTGKGGRFDVRVEATYMGQMAVAVVHESNGEPVDVVKPVPKKGHKMLWIVIIGAAAAGGALAAMNKSRSSDSGSSSPTGTVTIGIPTVGAPQ
jgi:hypothetical protein